MIDRGWIINSGLEHLLLASGSTDPLPADGGRNADRPGVINVHKSSSFPDGPVREVIAVDHSLVLACQSAPLSFHRFRSREKKEREEKKRKRERDTLTQANVNGF